MAIGRGRAHPRSSGGLSHREIQRAVAFNKLGCGNDQRVAQIAVVIIAARLTHAASRSAMGGSGAA